MMSAFLTQSGESALRNAPTGATTGYPGSSRLLMGAVPELGVFAP
jgi:hypothetical protein